MAYCDRCERWFTSDRALEQHKADFNAHWPCDDCDLDFGSFFWWLEHHKQSPNHHYCTECDLVFNFEESKIQHMEAKHDYCLLHDTIFMSEADLQSHYGQSSDHHICQKCGCDFDDEDELWDHVEEEHHACWQCEEYFDDYEELQEHDRDVHTYCTDCKRSFQNESNLRHHLNSKLHQPAIYHCPGRGCHKSFISPAALTHHFESGTCPSRMTREQLNRLVVCADTDNYITNPSRLITGPLGWSEPPPSAMTWATELSRNGDVYECFLCNATFGTLPRLNQHLRSPRHDEKIYRCPKADCRTEFVTLSGLCQHVEGGSCGVRMFRRVRDTMESLTRGFNMLDV